MFQEKTITVNRLLSRLREGDKAAAEALYFEISPEIRHIAMKYLPEFEADDAVQDFWKDLERIADRIGYLQNGYAFLIKTMTRRAIDRAKKLSKEKKIVVRSVDYEKYFSESDSLEKSERFENKLAVEEAFRLLSEQEKIIVQSAYFEGLTVREIAKQLMISKNTVLNVKTRAEEKMKAFLDEALPSEKKVRAEIACANQDKKENQK